MIFKDRKDAAVKLASKLSHYKDKEDVIVLALPRGGVVTGFYISNALNCPLDIIIIRKIGFPGNPELAIGAISETGTVVLNEDIISSYRIHGEYIKSEIKRQQGEISRRKTLYRGGKEIPPLQGKTIIVVDDGIATGATMKAAIKAIKNENISWLVIAVPVASPDSAAEIKEMVDEWVCLETPYYFNAVGSFYENFSEVSDKEVIELLST